LDGEFVSKTLHVTQVALGHDAKEGDHTLYIQRDGSSYALGTLNKKMCPHMKLDLVLVDEEVVMKHTGKSVVHVTGYEGLSYGAQDSSDDEDPYADLLLEGDDSEEEEEEEEEEDDDDEEASEEDSEDSEEEAPELVGLQNIPSADDDDSIDVADVSDSDIDMGIESDDESDDESGDESGDDSENQDDSSSEELNSDAEIDMSDSDSEEEREEMKKRLKNVLMTPQPSAKKQKVADAPATAPPKITAVKTPTNEKEYKDALKKFLKDNGPTKLASLGSAVKRPPSVPKLKKFLASHASDFGYNTSTDIVSLL